MYRRRSNIPFAITTYTQETSIFSINTRLMATCGAATSSDAVSLFVTTPLALHTLFHIHSLAAFPQSTALLIHTEFTPATSIAVNRCFFRHASSYCSLIMDERHHYPIRRELRQEPSRLQYNVPRLEFAQAPRPTTPRRQYRATQYEHPMYDDVEDDMLGQDEQLDTFGKRF
jgi:hypothetical protein